MIALVTCVYVDVVSYKDVLMTKDSNGTPGNLSDYMCCTVM